MSKEEEQKEKIRQQFLDMRYKKFDSSRRYDIYISKETLEDIRNWDIEIDEKIKKEIDHD